MHGGDERVGQTKQNTGKKNQPQEHTGMFGITSQPPFQHLVNLQGERKTDEAHEEHRKLGTHHQQLVHACIIFLRITFGELRIDRRLKIDAEVVDDVLYLYGDASRRIDRRIEKNVEQDIQSLRIAEHGQVAVHGPAGVIENLLEQGFVYFEVERLRFLEFSGAIRDVDQKVEELDTQDEQRIENQFVVRQIHEEEHRRQFQNGIAYGEVGKGRHLFVRDDDRIVGHADEASDGGEDGELVHPEGRRFSFWRNVQLGRDEPQAEGFPQHQNEKGKEQVNEEDVPKSRFELR